MDPSLVALPAVGLTGFTAGLSAMRSRIRQAMGEADVARRLAEHDVLTGLPNRLAARQRYQRDADANGPSTVVILDLDGFKKVNDRWGHQAGDALLTAIAHRLDASCQAIGATAFRLGGDEFVLLLKPTTPQTALRQVATVLEELHTALSLTIDGGRSVITFPSASAGVAVASASDTFSDLLRRADIALYRAKRSGSSPRLASPDLRQPPSHRHKVDDTRRQWTPPWESAPHGPPPTAAATATGIPVIVSGS